jgi:hypothetical protein
VIWHRHFLESDDFVTAEYFEYERFGRFLVPAEVLRDTFARLREVLFQAKSLL